MPSEFFFSIKIEFTALKHHEANFRIQVFICEAVFSVK